MDELENKDYDLIKRVEISWDGLVLRNLDNEKVFYADMAGNLTLIGNINAAGGQIGGWQIGANQLSSGSTTTFVGINSDSSNSYAIWAGASIAEATVNNTTTYAPFSVTKTGQLRATGAIISGDINATAFKLNGVNLLDGNNQINSSFIDSSQYQIDGISTINWGAVAPKNKYVALTSSGGLLLGADNGIVIPRFTPVELDNNENNDNDNLLD